MGAVGGVAQEPASPHQQVVELEAAGCTSLLGRGEHEATEPAGHVGEGGGSHVVDRGRARLGQVPQRGPHPGHVGPVALLSPIEVPEPAIPSRSHRMGERDGIDLVEGGGQLVAVAPQLRKGVEQLVVGVEALVAPGQHGVEPGQQGVGAELGWRRRVEREAALQEIPVLAHLGGHGAQGVEAHAGRVEDEQ